MTEIAMTTTPEEIVQAQAPEGKAQTPEETPKAASKEKKHKCTHLLENGLECGKAFQRPADLKLHGHTHTNTKPFKCKVPGCGKSFAHGSNLNIHVTTVHEKSKPYQCHVDGCKKMFTHPSSLKEHEDKHSNKRSRICDECDATFIYNKCLSRHKKLKHSNSSTKSEPAAPSAASSTPSSKEATPVVAVP